MNLKCTVALSGNYEAAKSDLDSCLARLKDPGLFKGKMDNSGLTGMVGNYLNAIALFSSVNHAGMNEGVYFKKLFVHTIKPVAEDESDSIAIYKFPLSKLYSIIETEVMKRMPRGCDFETAVYMMFDKNIRFGLPQELQNARTTGIITLRDIEKHRSS